MPLGTSHFPQLSTNFRFGPGRFVWKDHPGWAGPSEHIVTSIATLLGTYAYQSVMHDISYLPTSI